MSNEPNLLSEALMPEFREEVEKLALFGTSSEIRTLARVVGLLIDEVENLSVVKLDNLDFFGPSVPLESNHVDLDSGKH